LATVLSYFDALILGIVEGLTEFLPVSSTGHLNLTEKLLGLTVDDPRVTAYTAIIQLPAILATLIYFFPKIRNLVVVWARGLKDAGARTDPQYSLAWAVILGSMPVAFAGLLAKQIITGPFRSLWVFAGALLAWSVVIALAERHHASVVAKGQERAEGDVTIKDGIIIGLVQCLSPMPGISRSGATISAGLFRNLNRVTATELSFFLAIPALTAAGLYQAWDERAVLPSLGLGPMLLGCVVSFIVAYASIAWLLRFVRSNSLMAFVWYRVALGLVLLVVLGAGWMSPV